VTKSKLKRFAIVFIVIVTALFVYVAAKNRNSNSMTLKQKVLKAFYPLVMSVSKLSGKKSKMKTNHSQAVPAVSFYSLYAIDNQGSKINFEQFKGKKVLLVNTASECGYTPQYHELQELSNKYRNKLVVLGFPANDFGEQEKGNDAAIASFCKKNYGVSFPLAQKSSVVKGNVQNKVFEWLSSSKENGWNDQQPVWNFTKYLVDEKGVLTHYFEPSTSPLGDEVVGALNK
jgi:glutathione peroxidase